MLVAAVLILAGCGGGGSKEPQVVSGDGFSFRAPADWVVERSASSTRATDGDVDLVSVRTFRLVKPYRPALFAAATTELDRVAGQLASRLKGRVAERRTVRVAGRKARSYRIDYDGKAQEITFVLDGRREFQLLCRRETDGGDGACRQLVTSFALA